MKKYLIVATAKYPVRVGKNWYKIGENIPTEILESEYEFLKEALNVESITEITQSKPAQAQEQEPSEPEETKIAPKRPYNRTPKTGG